MPTFNPRDDELIEYLNKKITGNYDSVASSEINELNILNHEPHEFPGLVRIQSSHTWYFISLVKKLNGIHGRRKRSLKTGHWKITGKPIDVTDGRGGNIIGFKKILVFQEKKNSSSSSSTTKQNKTDWIIHEYHSNIQNVPNKAAFVLCKLKKKITPPCNTVADVGSPVVTDRHPFPTSDPNISHFQESSSFDEMDRAFANALSDKWEGLLDD